MRILVVEDDAEIACNLQEILTSLRYIIEIASSGEEALYKINTQTYDLIIIDWMLPDMEGVQICQEVRNKQIDTPLLMLTSKSQLEDKVEGLSSGADDYLTKPFAMEELIARINVLLRRKGGHFNSPVLVVGDLRIDTHIYQVERDGKLIELSPKEYLLLEYLAANKGEAIDRIKILEHVWGDEIDQFSNTVDVHIRYLRRKIDEGHKVKLIKTIKGKGYAICDN